MVKRAFLRLAPTLAFTMLIGVTSLVQAQVCNSCSGASQYYQGRRMMASHCCPQCSASNMCCCPQCMAPGGAVHAPMGQPMMQPGQPAPMVAPGVQPGGVPAAPGGVPSAPGGVPSTPGFDAGAMAGSQLAPGSVGTGDLASNQSTASAPNMIGDFFTNGITANLPTIGVDGGSSGYYSSHSEQQQTGTNLAVAGGDRRIKFAENVNPFPTDRVFFNYSHFENPLTDDNGNDVDVDRFVFGLERTALGGNASAEIRIPFAVGLSSQQWDASESLTGAEFGNLHLNIKTLLLSDGCGNSAVSAGTAYVFPTGPDAEYFDTSSVDNPTDLRYVFENDAIHVMPYIAFFKRRGCGWVTFTTQLDFATRDDDILFFNPSGPDEELGLKTQDFMYLDLQLGRDLYNSCNACGLNRVAGIVELHYNTTLTDGEIAEFSNGDSFSSTVNRFDVLNMTGGLSFQYNRTTDLNLFAVAPLKDDADVGFDVEWGVQLTKRIGRSAGQGGNFPPMFR